MGVDKLTKLAFLLSVFSVFVIAVVFIFILSRWNFSENIIMIGPRSKPVVLLLTAVGIAAGVGGFWFGLEGAADNEDRTRRLGWIAFWTGVAGMMVGVVCGLCSYFYSL